MIPHDRDEADALADGLVIGHFLTRGHYRDRIDELHDELDDLHAEQRRWEEDVVGDTVGFDGVEDVPLDEFDALAGHAVEPWYDDLFDLDDEDED